MNEMVDRYGRGKVKYGLIVFGDTPVTKITLQDDFPTDDSLKRFIDSVPRGSGGPALDKALEEARKLFQTSGRSQAKKILVVISDKQSTSRPVDVQDKARALELQGTDLVIAVVIGNEGDPKEMSHVTSDKGDVIPAKTSDKPKDIADKIAERIRQGEFKRDPFSHPSKLNNTRSLNIFMLQLSPVFFYKLLCKIKNVLELVSI